MKKLKYLLVTILAFHMISCENDDFGPVEAIFTEENEILFGFSENNSSEAFEGESVSIEVVLSKPLSVESVVYLGLTSSDGSLETQSTDMNGNPITVSEVTFPSKVIVPAGETSVVFSVDFTDDTISDIFETYTLEILNFVKSDNTSDHIISNGYSKKNILVIDEPTVITTIMGDVEILLKWDTSEDLDLYLRDEPGFDGGNPNLDFSWFSQPESMTMNSSLADGTYYIGVDSFFDVAPFGVACFLSLTFPDGVNETILTNLDEFIWIRVDKTTDGSEVTYTIYN